MKKPPYSASFSIVMSIVDIGILIVAYKSVQILTPGATPPSGWNFIAFVTNAGLSWIFFSQLCKINLPSNNRSVFVILKTIFGTSLLFICSMLLFSSLAENEYTYSWFTLVFVMVFIFLASVFRILFMKLYGQYRGLKGNRKNYIIIGFNQRGIRLSDYFRKRPELGYNFVGYLDDHEKHPLVLGKVADFIRVFDLKNIDEIYFALPGTHPSLAALSEICDNHYIRLHLITNVTGLESEKIDFNVVEDIRMPLLSSLGVPAGCFMNYRLRRAGSKAIWRINALLRSNHQPTA